MMRCTVRFISPAKTATVERGETLIAAAARAGIVLRDLCGGQGTCGRCRMLVKQGTVAGGMAELLPPRLRGSGAVLGCRATVQSDVLVEIPAGALMDRPITPDDAANRQSGGPLLQGCELDPLVKQLRCGLPQPSLDDQRSDHERLTTAVAEQINGVPVTVDVATLRTIPQRLAANGYEVSVTVAAGEFSVKITAVEPPGAAGVARVIAVDIGTTTVVAGLVDTQNAAVIDTAACRNSQASFGRDVTTRLIAAEKSGGAALQALIVADINNLAGVLAERNGLQPAAISALICSGNTAMTHFLLDLPVHGIRRLPYAAASLAPPPVAASSIGVRIGEAAPLFTVPGISSWVGGDLTAGIIATAMHRSQKLALLFDIGTNGEIVVGNRDWLVATSASAGPALEGASVAQGMSAGPGAIERVAVTEGGIRYWTIGKMPARGICGSGIIELLSALLECGWVNRSGAFIGGPSNRLTRAEGVAAYVVATELETGGAPILFSEADIEQVITAKAALFAAMAILLKRLDLAFGDIGEFLIAGAFGAHIDVPAAMRIGLLPPIDAGRIRFVGNTSLIGAAMAAVSRQAYGQMQTVAQSVTYYDLMGAGDYVEEFSKARFLPHTDIERFS